MADPVPQYVGNEPPPRVNIDGLRLVSGPLAPRRAIEWLRAVAPVFSWGDPATLANATIKSRSRDFIEVRFAIESTANIHTVKLRVFRSPIDLIAISEAGVCCCGACSTRIVFLRVGGQKVADVTDQVWPRFRFVTVNATADSRLVFRLPARGSTISIYSDQGRPGIRYRLQWFSRSRRFELHWKEPTAQAPYPWKDAGRCTRDRDCWPNGKRPRLQEGTSGLICIDGRCQAIPIPH